MEAAIACSSCDRSTFSNFNCTLSSECVYLAQERSRDLPIKEM
ncbi:MAG TPA: hypothetical protein VK211_00535 [Kamptonema sp.]|nr:hypothetical protein [Kamptonema sp.]